MQITRIDHVSLDVRDRPSAIAWYGEVLGLRASDSIYFSDPEGTTLEVAVPRS